MDITNDQLEKNMQKFIDQPVIVMADLTLKTIKKWQKMF
jgi:hypothetical protein